MLNSNEINYFGKLRRRREFLKSATLSEDLYNFWGAWFSKCSRQNSFLPFLDSRNKAEHPTWLFIIRDEANIKIGLTIMSSDMSDRSFPFIVYYNTQKLHIENKESLEKDITDLARRFNKFKKIIAIGSLDTLDLETFESNIDNNEISTNLKINLDSITQQVIDKSTPSTVISYWINLNTSSYLLHDGAFTCALYNKVYG